MFGSHRGRAVAFALVASLCAGGHLRAQIDTGHETGPTLVVPAANFGIEGKGVAFWALSPFDARRQLAIAGAAVAPIKGELIRGITLRRNATLDVLEGGDLELEIWMSHAATSPWTMSTRFDANRGPDHVKVFDGVVRVPRSPVAFQRPVPWIEPYTVHIDFNVPFLFRGGALLIETVTKNQPEDAPWWPIDAAVATKTGTVQKFGTSCIPFTGPEPATADPASLTVGATATFSLRGFEGVEGLTTCILGPSKQFAGNIPLPWDLTSVGARFCYLYVQPKLRLPAQIVEPFNGPFGTLGVRIDIPLDSALEGTTLFAQWVLVEPRANALGMLFSNGVEATIGPSRMRNMNWLESMDLSATHGTLLPGRVPVISLDV